VGEIDTRDMLVVHRAFRREFAELGDLVAAVPDGDVPRARVVGEHVVAMTSMLQSHHASEDEVLWPIMKERAPDRSALAAEMEGQHELIEGLISNAEFAAKRWMASGSSSDASNVCRCMEQMSMNVDVHLAREEEAVLPLAAALFTQEEWAGVGEHSRSGLTADQRRFGLGVIESASTDDEWARIWDDLPPAAREEWETTGRPAFAEYRARLIGA
jgi:hemerythrin-like domain-containing protein